MAKRRSRREVALDYLVSVVESTQADPARRDAAARELLKQGATAAAPAAKPKKAAPPPLPKDDVEEPKPAAVGKKEQQHADAVTAGKGTPWEGKL